MRRSVALSFAAFAAVAVTAILALRATDRVELPLRDAALLDVLLAERVPSDDQIAAAMRRVQTIAIAALDDHGRWLLPVVAGTVAHGSFELDHDGIVRRFASTKQSGNRAL